VEWKKCTAVVFAGATLLGVAAAGTRASHEHEYQSRWYGKLAESQVLEQAEGICRTALANTGALNLWVDTASVQSPRRRTSHFWTIDCADQTGEDLLHLGWDADAGRIAWVSRHTLSVPPSRPPLTRFAAVQVGRSWMWKLGIACKGEKWRLLGEPDSDESTWHVYCASRNRRATIVIGISSGELVSAKSYAI
jgi:hypothetical protein